jgi:antitoxin CptB
MKLAPDRESNRLRWRCRRGMRELDVILMRYVDAHYDSVSAAEQAAFRVLLSLPDPDILGLLTARDVGDDTALDRVVSRLLAQRVS